MEPPTEAASRKIVVGVGGGIAAYKSAELVRRLRDANCSVRVVMTSSAREFVTPLTFQALSGHPVRSELFDAEAESGMDHIRLARWADQMVIAPATANLMARIAHGMADDLLTTLCLATQAPLLLAPAMNRIMWENPATQANLSILCHRGIATIGPGDGLQACGETGAGRMAEPQDIVRAMLQQNPATGPMTGRKVVVTTGPTREPIDPVRYLGNRSSGAMGVAMARAAQAAGAEVILVHGPLTAPLPENMRTVSVETAEQMHHAVAQVIDGADLFIGAAAVADFRPAEQAQQKLKKTSMQPQLTLLRNPDILASVAARNPRPFVVGFAAETEQIEDHARSKLQQKNLDMIAANDVSAGKAFGAPDNALLVLWPGGSRKLERQPKDTLAEALLTLIIERLQACGRLSS